MDTNRNSDKTEPPTKLKLENTMDTSGTWFAVAVLLAVISCPRQLQVRDSSRTVPTR
jgi:hypothetical protein